MHPPPSSPMSPPSRCGARTRSGSPCRLHGTGGGAPEGNRNALKHGRYTAEAIEHRRMVRELLRAARELAQWRS
jgi:uncharacterized protein YjcR